MFLIIKSTGTLQVDFGTSSLFIDKIKINIVFRSWNFKYLNDSLAFILFSYTLVILKIPLGYMVSINVVYLTHSQECYCLLIFSIYDTFVIKFLIINSSVFNTRAWTISFSLFTEIVNNFLGIVVYSNLERFA